MFSQTATQHRSAEMEQCIQNCQVCHHLCIETTSYCLQMGGKHAEHSHIRLLLDCVQICHTSEDFMLRDLNFHAAVCDVCADICEQCAEDCLRIDSRDAQHQACADACRRCSESCRAMAA